MPIYEVRCLECGRSGELLVYRADEALACPDCGGRVERLISAPSPLTGREAAGLPGPSDRSCCGCRPSDAGCAGPGSCCGKA
jgi:putative FmdB family regulatory protein